MYPYTDDDARAFRELFALPLAWEGDGPAPPLDRVTFTRLLLNAAHESGLGFPHPEHPVGYFHNEREFATLQERFARATGQRPVRPVVVPARGKSETWGTYLTGLERDYRVAARTARRLYDAGPDATAQALLWVREAVSGCGVADDTPAPDGNRLADGDHLSEFLTPEEGHLLEQTVQRRLCLTIPLVEDHFFGISAPALDRALVLLVAVPALALIVGPFVAAFRGLIPLWIAVLGLPVLLLLVFFLVVGWMDTVPRVVKKVKPFFRRRWLSLDLTFGELAARIAREKGEDWERLRGAAQAALAEAGADVPARATDEGVTLTEINLRGAGEEPRA